MKKKKHLHTNFIKFLLESHLEDTDVDDKIERPIPGEELEELKLRILKQEFSLRNVMKLTDKRSGTVQKVKKLL
jgi:hypothetical protein